MPYSYEKEDLVTSQLVYQFSQTNYDCLDSLKTVLDFYGSNIEVCDICFHKSCVILSLNDEV